ncbi:hypothetical protein V1525DRAFT_345656 [Lipomyces kononenkoae]|uniref:Uncharacterized protein n=1 Tax=Lipomyces kononenkoae TaxID=34357 RepID=A0ACC3SYC1_LIPKO
MSLLPRLPARITGSRCMRNLARCSLAPYGVNCHRRTYASNATSSIPLLKTPLYDLHLAHGASMHPFAGFSMPITYESQSIIESNKWVRSQAGLFDVSHMVQHRFTGKGVTEFLERITPTDVKELAPYTSVYSMFLNNEGGIVDDIIITKHADDKYYIVTNAACRATDLAFLDEQHKIHHPIDISHEILDGWGLVALQGPRAAEALQGVTDFDLTQLKFGNVGLVPFSGSKYWVSRSGYTGEDGFEISVPKDEALDFSELLLGHSKSVVKLAGLGVRDALRLEAGLCLYGQDLDETTTPIQASLSWVVGKRRRVEGGFNGFELISDELNNGATRRRVGFLSDGPPAREGSKIYDETGTNLIGVVTSGLPSPTVGKNIAMGYVEKGFMKRGTNVLFDIRSRKRPGTVAKMPFVPTKYYR